jgi:ADP-ribosyl-[dinitrogen reductase] hydrolase
MLAGAYYGMEAIPKRWIRKMDATVLAEIEIMAERLIAASPVGRGR